MAVKLVPVVTSYFLQLMQQLGLPSQVLPDSTDAIPIAANALTWVYIRNQA